jgi:hypothetical protein
MFARWVETSPTWPAGTAQERCWHSMIRSVTATPPMCPEYGVTYLSGRTEVPATAVYESAAAFDRGELLSGENFSDERQNIVS